MLILSVAPVEHIIGQAKSASYFALQLCEHKLAKVGTVNSSTTMQIQDIPTIVPPWTQLLATHWQSEILLATKLKSTTSVAILGLMFQAIHFTLRKYLGFFLSGNFSFRISAYATVTTSQGAMIIGGYNGKESVTTIADYTGNASGWTQIGDLHIARNGHRAIINVDQVFVVGGNLDEM